MNIETPVMTPERWQQIKQIFDQVTEAETGRREQLLATACADDADLRAEVEKLLRGHEQASGLFEQPAMAAMAKAAQVFEVAAADALIGQQIGPYKVLREIGHGGMGQVYLAVRADDEYKKRVALKIVKRGMDTEEIIRRFRNERQILAGLDHPNIGKLLDGGTTENGLPYFAMEYVAGKPITDYCDDRKLPTVERLKLFRQVCAAVQFAHQNLVIHRDIKPSNILVTEDGTPKLLDFGIAKVLNPELSGQTIDPTATALRLMTPEYASPEQVRGEIITTASDVYSLGVVLYELLTGHRPYRVKSRLPHEILRIVCEEEPEKPSTAVSRVEEGTSRDGSKPITLTPESVSRTREGEPEKLRRRLRGDLDNIVLMAMRKEPQRRYATVNQLSEDIRRHLEGMPVIASKDTLGYRIEKFIDRNRTAAAAAALVFLILQAGIVATWWQARIAQKERARAERRFNDVRKLANAFLYDVHDQIANLAGSTAARETLVKHALEYLDSLTQEAGNDRPLQFDLLNAYLKVGSVQYEPNRPNLGNYNGAMQSYKKALAIAERLSAQMPDDFRSRQAVAIVSQRIGDALIDTGHKAEAIGYQRKAQQIFETLYATLTPGDEKRLRLASAYISLGDNLYSMLDYADAVEFYRKALATYEEIGKADPSKSPRYNIAVTNERLARVFVDFGDNDSALDNYQRGLKVGEEALAADPNNAELRRGVAIGHLQVAGTLTDARRLDEAMKSYQQALIIFEDLAAIDPKNVTAKSDISVSLEGVANLLAIKGNHNEAINYYRRDRKIWESLAEIKQSSSTRSNVAWVDAAIGARLAAIGDFAGAIAQYRQSISALDALMAKQPDVDLSGRLADILHDFGTVLAKANRAGEVRQQKARCLALLKGRADRSEATAGDFNQYAFFASIIEPGDLGDSALALSYANRAVEMSQGKISYYHNTLAVAYHKNGDYARAIEIGENALSMISGNSYRRRTFEADLLRFKAAQHHQNGEYARAIELINNALVLLGEDLTRGPAFEADLAKYKAAAQRQPKR